MSDCMWEASYGRVRAHLELLYERLIETLNDPVSLFLEIVKEVPPFIRLKRDKDELCEFNIYSSLSFDGINLNEILKPRGDRLYVICGEISLQSLDSSEISIFQVLPFNPSKEQLRYLVQAGFQLFYLKERQKILQRQLEKTKYKFTTFLDISFALNTIKKPKLLFEYILEKYRELTSSDAGSIYVVEKREGGKKVIKFITAQNDSIPLDLEAFELPLSKDSIAGASVLEKRVFNIPDVTDTSLISALKHNNSLDQMTGYKTKSMLVVPLINHLDEAIGVVQLINKKRDKEKPLLSETDFEENVIPFTSEDEEILTYLSGQVAISLENTLLYNEILNIFDSFVKASINAIEQRDPSTSGHTQRVALLSVRLAKAINKVTYGKYKDICFTEEDIKRIEYAALLHDFGKIGIREKILLKKDKLPEGKLELIKERLKRVKLYLQLSKDREGLSLESLNEYMRLIEKANSSLILSQEEKDKIMKLGEITITFPDGEKVKLLQEEEVLWLLIEGGTLSPDEKKEIEKHSLFTYSYLKEIPWHRTMIDLPFIAASHHEKLDGSGYPWGLKGDEIPIESRIVMIADLFDALQSSDRPYKTSIPIEKCLDILKENAEAGKLDKELVEIFIKERIYLLSSQDEDK